MIKIKSPICLSFKPPSALRQQTHITNMRPLACLDGDLKSGVSGIIGETNTGYLGFVTAKKEKQDLVAAENKDRKAIYTHIAKKEQVSTQFVQERRAASLFSNAAKGHYYQNKAGVWVKK
ncbi:MAG: hypothetical protein CSA25_00400 [Desulfobacter postgatei]|uniref:DUF1318 domain-containing protein n=1 Tax=Desulfobacter postgatei TaxID=2293 RepID=A0A2G6MTZ9_9BACT|nr:MAG: hypothetical protein CSA25_00400 [Desulfobacter postgatei]